MLPSPLPRFWPSSPPLFSPTLVNLHRQYPSGFQVVMAEHVRVEGRSLGVTSRPSRWPRCPCLYNPTVGLPERFRSVPQALGLPQATATSPSGIARPSAQPRDLPPA